MKRQRSGSGSKHFTAGRRALLAIGTAALFVASVLAPAAAQETATPTAALLFEEARQAELSEGDLDRALELYTRITTEHAANRELASRALLRIGRCHEKLGDARAREIYQRVLSDYGDQAEVAADARARLAALAADDDNGPLAPAGLVARRILDSPPRGPQYFGAPSPDGRHLSVIDWTTGDIAVRDLEAGETRRLSEIGYPQMPQNSIFSPDGATIAYAWFNNRFFYDLRLVGVDGGESTVVYADPDFAYVQPEAWSADGTWILALLAQRDRSTSIARVTVADGSARVIRELGSDAPRHMSLSPDARFVAYELAPDEAAPDSHDIRAIATDGGRDIALATGPADDASPIWSPRGDHLLYVSNRGGAYDLWAQAVRDGEPVGRPRVVKAGTGEIHPMGFTADGSLYYGIDNQVRDIRTARYDPATGRLEPVPYPGLETRLGSNLQARWSPDGERLAYFNLGPAGSDGSSSSMLVIRTLATGSERAIPRPTHLRSVLLGDWSPDGSRILARAFEGRQGVGLYWLDVATGGAELITRGEGSGANLTAPELSPDGETLYFARGGSIVARPVSGGDESTLGPPDTFVDGFTLALSPDGTKLAFRAHPAGEQFSTKAPRPLVTMDVSGGEVSEVLTHDETIWSLAWTPDGRHLLAVVPERRSGAPRSGTTTMARAF
ncbi:MAG: tetratricopeptide repeat protein, partial [Thermoanaerobaculia bacterium]|nr:tetratricopeptide repeat protein [Thermoanaerobaculia bacterium]